MTTAPVPQAYDAALTAKRSDLTGLRSCWWEFVRRFSPRCLLAAVAVAVVARVLVGQWSWRDALLVIGVIAAQPFVEWIIHRYLLHLPPFRLFGREIELYGAVQHRHHHELPSDLDRVLLGPIEAVSFLAQIAAANALVIWGYVAVVGGHFVPLWLTATGLCYMGLLRYEWSHFLIHTPYVPKTRWYRTIWRNHRLHHYKHEGYWMGVSSNFGDRVLGTNPDQRTIERSPTARTLAQRPRA